MGNFYLRDFLLTLSGDADGDEAVRPDRGVGHLWQRGGRALRGPTAS